MTRPHEALGLPQPVGRRLPQGLSGWNVVLALASAILVVLYIVQVNGAASASYRLRQTERRVETLRTEATVLQNAYVARTSLQSLSTQAMERGFIPVDQIEYLNPSAAAYAMAR